ncbi:MAG: leucine-rich repeat domain-containing protein [Clostridiales bacterium]|nr:leucine-rich repeat domain-containing protein [Clostridiales bacterium]
MKRLKRSLFVLILLLVAVFLPSTATVHAEEVVDKNFPVEVEDCDERLYGVLSQMINKKTLYIKDFIDVEELNLGEKTNKLTTLSGLDNFRFDNLKTLNIEGNEIVSVSAEQLSSMPNLETINLSGNAIESVDLSGLNKLQNVILFSNKLKSINLSHVTSSEITINIANNDFTSMNDISLPLNATTINLNILNNNITDIGEDYLNSSKLKITGGIQGIKSDSEVKLSQSAGLTVYPIQDENISIKIFNNSGEVVKEISGSETITEKLPIGKYHYDYYLNGEKLYDDENLNHKNGYTEVVYKGYTFVIIPNAPSYEFVHKGKTSTTLNKVTGVVTVNLSANDEGVDVYYKVGSDDWQKGSQIVCDKGGNYSIQAKTVIEIDGVKYESEIVPIYVKTSLNLYIPDFLMLIIVLLIMLTLLGVIFPIINKKFFKKK